ncbi:MAG: molybdopterin-dependent oxidoreductase [Candidatus Acidiferrales bacterium]
MLRTRLPAVLRLIISLCALAFLAGSGAVAAAAPGESAALTVSGDVKTPLSLSLDDLKKMPHETLVVVNPHTKKVEIYEGVPLAALLQAAGVPHGEELRGAAMTGYVMAAARDHYRVAFSLAELDPAFLDSGVIVADTLDGQPLPADLGPLRLVAPHEKRPARWIRMLESLTVVIPAKAAAAEKPAPK